MPSFPTSPGIDSFGRTENPVSDGGKWSNPIETVNYKGNMKTDGSALLWTGTPSLSGGSAYRNDMVFKNAEAYFTVIGNVTKQHGVWLRIQTPGGSSANGYAVIWTDATAVSIYKMTNSEYSQLNSFACTKIAGDVLGARISRDSITAFQNGISLGTVTDSTYSAAGYIGAGGTDSTSGMDNFGGGAYSLPVVPNYRVFPKPPVVVGR